MVVVIFFFFCSFAIFVGSDTEPEKYFGLATYDFHAAVERKFYLD